MCEDAKTFSCPSMKFTKIYSLEPASSLPTVSLAVRSLMNSIQRGFEACGLSPDDILWITLGDMEMSIRSDSMTLELYINKLLSQTSRVASRSLELTSRRNKKRTHMNVVINDYDSDEAKPTQGNIHDFFTIIKKFQKKLLPAEIKDVNTEVMFCFSGSPSVDRSFAKMGR